MANTNLKLDRVEISDDDDDEVVLVTAAAKPSLTTPVSNRKHQSSDDEDDDDDDDEPCKEADLKIGLDNLDTQIAESDATGMMILALLDKIIGMVDQIQLTQNGLESRQEKMEKSMTSIKSELGKLAKSQDGTSGTVNKLLEKVRKVNVNVKTVRNDLDKQVGQIRKLENNEQELLKRKNFKVLIYQDKEKPEKMPKQPEALAGEEKEQVGTEEAEGEEQGSGEVVEVEETVEESRVARIKRSGLQRVDDIKKAFSKEQMEKTKQRTKENLEKTRQRTKENLEKTRLRTRENLQKTRQSLGNKMGKLGTKIKPNKERKGKARTSRDKLKKSLKYEQKVYGRTKITTYRVPPFTFYVKKVHEGEDELEQDAQQGSEGQDVKQQVENKNLEVQEAELVNLSSPEIEQLHLTNRDLVQQGERAGL